MLTRKKPIRTQQRKEISYNGVTVVFDEHSHGLDEKRRFLVNCILLYANIYNKGVKIIFFNGKPEEIGVSFFFERRKYHD